ncbi:Mss4-like protein, partial [Melampsora americana]
MIMFTDVVSGDEVCSDALDMKDVDGVFWEVNCPMMAIKAHLQETKPDRVAEFKKLASGAAKNIVANFKDYEFYIGEKMNPDGSTSRCLTTPTEPVTDLPPVYPTTSFAPPIQQHFSTNSNTSSLMIQCYPELVINSPELWSELDLNRYLLNYPGGRDLCLEQLAIKSWLLNFDCGIDKMCYAGELCSPVRGKDWYLLVAAQEWNSFMNIIYRAIGFAMTMMQGIIPSMISDLFQDE